jgi:hypothetical protein
MVAIGLRPVARERDYLTVCALGRRRRHACCLQRVRNAGKMLRVLLAEMQVIRFHPFRRSRMPLGAFALVLALTQPGLGRADEEADRLKLRALIEEGDLILEEALALQPAADTLAADGAQLDAAEASIRADSASQNEAILKFNADNIELERQVKAHQAACPRESEDKALVESCNARALELQPIVRAHEEQRRVLQQRQKAMQQRIDAHNAARRDWAERKRELDPKVQANRKDADYWLGEARTFLAGDGFRGLATKAGAPAACDVRKLGDLAAPPAIAAAGRVHACFKAVAGGSQ